MRLSPDGTHVAILLPSLELDLPGQLWLYRVVDHKLISVTPPPGQQDVHPVNAVAAITALAWQGDTIFVLASLWGDSGESQTAIYTATVDGSRSLREVPDDIKGHFESINGGLVIKEDELPEDEAATESMRGNVNYLVWTANRGHGTIDLRIRPRSPGAKSYLVAWGGWELTQFLFDSARSRLVYPADTGIALFDMATHGERRITGTSRGDQPYAVSADHGTVLWSTRNHCGDEFLADPDTGAPEHFCLAAMTGH